MASKQPTIKKIMTKILKFITVIFKNKPLLALFLFMIGVTCLTGLFFYDPSIFFYFYEKFCEDVDKTPTNSENALQSSNNVSTTNSTENVEIPNEPKTVDQPQTSTPFYKNKYFIGSVVVVSILILGIGYFYFGGGNNDQNQIIANDQPSLHEVIETGENQIIANDQPSLHEVIETGENQIITNDEPLLCEVIENGEDPIIVMKSDEIGCQTVDTHGNTTVILKDGKSVELGDSVRQVVRDPEHGLGAVMNTEDTSRRLNILLEPNPRIVVPAPYTHEELFPNPHLFFATSVPSNPICPSTGIPYPTRPLATEQDLNVLMEIAWRTFMSTHQLGYVDKILDRRLYEITPNSFADLNFERLQAQVHMSIYYYLRDL